MRNAARRGAAQISNVQLDEALARTIAQLTGRSSERSWLQGFLTKLCHTILSPAEIFEVEAVREWLDDAAVRKAIAVLAMPRMIGREIGDPAVRHKDVPAPRQRGKRAHQHRWLKLGVSWK
jgi:hypothetical protein